MTSSLDDSEFGEPHRASAKILSETIEALAAEWLPQFVPDAEGDFRFVDDAGWIFPTPRRFLSVRSCSRVDHADIAPSVVSSEQAEPASDRVTARDSSDRDRFAIRRAGDSPIHFLGVRMRGVNGFANSYWTKIDDWVGVDFGIGDCLEVDFATQQRWLLRTSFDLN